MFRIRKTETVDNVSNVRNEKTWPFKTETFQYMGNQRSSSRENLSLVPSRVVAFTVVSSLKFFRVGGLDKWRTYKSFTVAKFHINARQENLFSILMKFLQRRPHFSFSDFGKSSWMFFTLGISIDVKIWQLIEKVTGNCTVFAPRSHFVNEISKEPAARLVGSSCNWLIMLVTMATPRSSHVKVKNSIFTACDEDMIF